MSGKKKLQLERISMVRLPEVWYWVVVAGVIILAAGVATLFGETNDVPVLEDTSSPDSADESDPVPEVELQPEDPTSRDTAENVDPSTKVELQLLFNDLRKEYLDIRAKFIDWWLEFIAIVLTFFAIVIAVFGFVSFREFRRIRGEAKEHVEEIEKDRDTVVAEFQELRSESEQHLSEMRAHIAAVRKGREEFDQESMPVRQEATERLDALVFDRLSGDTEFSELLDNFRQLPELSPLEEAVLDAYTLQQNGRIEEAIEKWRSIANITEKRGSNLTVQAWKSIGYLYLEEDSKEEALSAFDNAIRLKRDEAEIYALRGDVKALLENYESAIVDYNEAIRWGANLEEMHSNCADAKNALRRYDEAIVDCNEAIRLNPDYTEAYMVRGEARVGLQDSSQAITNFQRALELAVDQEQNDLIDRIEQRLREL